MTSYMYLRQYRTPVITSPGCRSSSCVVKLRPGRVMLPMSWQATVPWGNDKAIKAWGVCVQIECEHRFCGGVFCNGSNNHWFKRAHACAPPHAAHNRPSFTCMHAPSASCRRNPVRKAPMLPGCCSRERVGCGMRSSIGGASSASGAIMLLPPTLQTSWQRKPLVAAGRLINNPVVACCARGQRLCPTGRNATESFLTPPPPIASPHLDLE